MKGLPYGQFLRIRCICSNADDFEKHAAMKAAQLKQHGYPTDLLLDGMSRAWNYGTLRNLVESTWDLLGRSCTTRFIREKNLKVRYRRPKNLRDILVRARLPPESDGISVDATRPERPPCDRKNCRYCKCLNMSGKIQSGATNKSHNALRNVSFLSNNLVYCISCKNCGKQCGADTEQCETKIRFTLLPDWT